eukprot:2333125-Pleurochrysis_carterae.AAC.1
MSSVQKLSAVCQSDQQQHAKVISCQKDQQQPAKVISWLPKYPAACKSYQSAAKKTSSSTQ